MLEVDCDTRGLTSIKLDRTDKLNALDEHLIAELADAFENASGDPGTRVVLLTGAGKVFCAGADIDWMRRQSRQDEDENLEDARRFSNLLQLVHECRKPVVARVQGHAFGGGVGLVAASDIAVCVPTARFAVSETRFGIPPAAVGPYIMHAVGARHARRLAMTAEQIPAEEAFRLGLVHEIAPDGQLDEVVERIVGQLIANGPAALSETKALFHTLYGREIDEEIRELTTATMARMRSADEAQEGFAAFLEKRSVKWPTQ